MEPLWGDDLLLTTKEKVYFKPLSPQVILVLIWAILEVWKAEMTLEPTNGFEH